MRNGCLGKIDSSVGDAWTKCQVYTHVQLGILGLNAGDTTVEDPKIYVGLGTCQVNGYTVGDTKTAKCEIYCRFVRRQSARYTAVGPRCNLYELVTGIHYYNWGHDV